MNKKTKVFKDGMQFEVEFVCEIFKTPIMEYDDSEINDIEDLFRMSVRDGFDLLYLPRGESVSGTISGRSVELNTRDFIIWQLEKMNSKTIFQLANKTGMPLMEYCDTSVYPEEKFLIYEEEIALDPTYCPENWLNPYAEEEDLDNGYILIDRIRKTVGSRFYEILVDSLLSEESGILQYLETEASESAALIKSQYKGWDVPLLIISQGAFFPYISDDAMMMDDWQLISMYVRNYDEGEKLE